MALESYDKIDSFVRTNPVNATDTVASLGGHVRGMKGAILDTFPNITGAVTSTHTELNYVDGVTGVEGTGKLVLANAAVLPALSGVNLTALNASNLASGTIPDARFPATLPAASGVNLTALNGTNIASGTVDDARLSSNIPKKGAANTFTAGGSATTPPIRIGTGSDAFTTGATTLLGLAAAGQARFAVRDETNDSEFALIAYSGGSQLGAITNHALEFITNGTVQLTLGTSGQVTTNNTRSDEVGYKGSPTNLQNNLGGAYTLATSDQGKTIVLQGSTTGITVTSGKPSGMNFTVVNNTGGNITITQSSTSLYLAGVSSGSPGNRTLADRGVMYCVACFGADAYICSGTGVS